MDTRKSAVPFRRFDPESVSRAPLPACFEDCPTCASHFIPKSWLVETDTFGPTQIDDETAAKEAQEMANNAKSAYSSIRDTIDQYGSVLAKRWQKRSIEKRKALLLEAMPKMYKKKFGFLQSPTEARPATASMAVKTAGPIAYTGTDVTADCEGMLNPYLDLMTLSEDACRLIALLHYRSHQPPTKWVMYDFEITKFYWNSPFAPLVRYNSNCIGMNGADFGRLVPWNDMGAHNFDIIGYPRAYLILRSQAVLGSFLLRVTELILQSGVQGARIGRESWDEQVRGGLKLSSSAFITPSTISDQAFSSPPALDLPKILETLEARSNAATDDLFLLQTDPSYLHRILTQCMNGRLGARVPARDKSSSRLRFINHRILTTHMWQLLYTSAQKLRSMSLTYGAKIRAGARLPEDWSIALGLVEFWTETALTRLINTIGPMVLDFDSKSSAFEVDGNGEITIKENRDACRKRDPMLWAMMELYDQRKSSCQDVSWYIAFLDDTLSQTSDKQRARLHPLLYERLSDMAVMSGVLMAIRYNRPHHSPEWDDEFFFQMQASDINFCKWKKSSEACVHQETLADSIHCEALDRIVSLPMPSTKPTTKSYDQWNELDKAARDFWAGMRTGYGHFFKQGRSSFSVNYHNQEAMAEWDAAQDATLGLKSQDHVETVKQYTEFISARIGDEGKAAFRELIKPHLEFRIKSAKAETTKSTAKQLVVRSPVESIDQTTWGETKSESVQVAPKSKVKTRPAIVESASLTDPQRQTSSEQTSERMFKQTSKQTSEQTPDFTIEVSKASRAIFSRMFSADPKHHLDARWADVVAAMVDAGCSAVCSGGSAVSFKDIRNGRGTAVMHRPHPEQSLDHREMRWMGYRLNRRFGWNEETFVMKK